MCKRTRIMRKFWNYINSTPLNPIILILFSIVVGGLLVISLEGNDNSIEYFLTCIGLGISAAVVQCTLIQNRIQKDNIKIQLFNKRYSVFQSVLDSIVIIERNNWDRYFLFNNDDINKEIILIEENLYKSVQLSECLFDSKLHSKLIDVNNSYCKVANAYKNMIIANMLYLKEYENTQEFTSLLNSYIISNNGLNSKDYEDDLRTKFPNLYINLMEFSKECDAYIAFIKESGVVNDIRKYVVVSRLDI